MLVEAIPLLATHIMHRRASLIFELDVARLSAGLLPVRIVFLQ
jgi:hypothetical protein